MNLKKPQPLFLLMLALTIGSLWLMTTPSPILACPMCSDSLSNSDTADTTTQQDATTPPHQNGSLAEGFYYSILLMLAVPFSVMIGLGGMFYSAMHKKQSMHQRPSPNKPDQ